MHLNAMSSLIVTWWTAGTKRVASASHALRSTCLSNTWASCHMRDPQADVAAGAGRQGGRKQKCFWPSKAALMPFCSSTCRSESARDESNAFCATWSGGARVYRDFCRCTRSTVQCVCHELHVDRGRELSPVRHGNTNACGPKGTQHDNRRAGRFAECKRKVLL